jgi:hypothetical protein
MNVEPADQSTAAVAVHSGFSAPTSLPQNWQCKRANQTTGAAHQHTSASSNHTCSLAQVAQCNTPQTVDATNCRCRKLQMPQTANATNYDNQMQCLML